MKEMSVYLRDYYYPLVGVPRGVTGRHLKTSLHTASTNGSLERSSKVGSRSRPVAASISICTLLIISGWSAIAKKKVIVAAIVYVRKNRIKS